MFKQPKVPTPEPLPLGVDSSRMATNEPAIPLPWAVGKNRIALKWISPAFNQRTTEIKQKVGKKSQTTGYNVYADIAGAVCAGPVDRLYAIYIDGVLVWESLAAVRDGTNPHYYQTTVPTFGKFRIYWGTSTQPKDTLILNYAAPRDNTIDPDEEFWEYPNGNIVKLPATYSVAACPDDHPAYLDQCYMVWSQLFCGQNRESVPNIEVVVGKAARFSTLDTEVTDEGVNPVSAIAELLTNDLYGAGLPASVVDTSQWDAVATVAANRRTFARYTNPTPVSVPFGNISPIIDRQLTVKQLLNDLFLYFDGYVRPSNGKLEIGCFPHDGVIPSGLTTLSLQDDTQLPEYQPGSWADAFSQVTVIHRDGDRQFNDNAETSSLPLALQVTGQPRRESVQRPHFVTRWQAQEYATRWVQIHAHPQNLVRGRIRVRKEKAVNSDGSPILAGDRFIFDYAPYSLQVVARATSRTDQGYGGEVEISFEAERGIAPLPYVPQGDERPNEEQITPTAITNARMFQLPARYLNEPEPAVVPLVERPAASTTGFNAFFSTSDTTYDLAGTAVNWAIRGTLASGISVGDTSLTLAVSGLDLVKLQSQSGAAQVDDTLLLFVDSEIISVGTVTALGGGQYTLSLLRGRKGSSATSHLSAAVCYVMPRADLMVLQNANFPRAATTNYFKLQSFTQNDEQDLSAALKLTFTFADRGVTAPSNLSASGQTNGIYVRWDNPADPDLAYIEIFESNAAALASPLPITTAPDYTIAGNFFLRGGLTGGTTKYYWVRAVDTIGDKSDVVGPVYATATAPADGLNAKLVVLTSDSQTFQIAKDGTVSQSTVTLTASGQNLTGSPSWSVSAGTATLTGSGSVRTLTYANMTSDAVSITVTWDGVSDTISIVKVREGNDSITAVLSNEAQVVPADVNGNVTSFTGASTTMTIYKGTVDDSANWSISVSPQYLTVSTSGKTVSVTAMSADTGYADITATRSGYSSVTKRFTVSKSKTGATGNNGTNAKLVTLTSDSQTFQVAKSGTVTPSSITFTATGQNLTGSASWSVSSGTATLTGSGTTRNLTYANMTTDVVAVTVTWDGVSDTLSVAKVREGADGSSAKAVALAADSQVFQIAKDGTNTPASITFTATGQNVSGSPTFSVASGTATLTGTGNTRSLAFADMGTDAVKVAITWDGLNDAITVVKVREGTDSITGVLSNESHNVPADSSGTVSSWTGAETTMKVYKGATDDTANWSFSASTTYLTVTQSSNTFTATAMSADVGYADITASRTGYASVTKRFTVTKSKAGATGTNGTNGTRGSKQFYTTGTSWVNTTADAAITAAGLTKVLLDQVTISSSATGFSQTKYWDGADWQTITQVIDGNLLVNGSIGANKITANTLTASQINGAFGTLSISSGDIRSSNYSAGSAGWIIKSDGSAEFSSGTFRSTLDVGSGDTRFYKPVSGAMTFGNTSNGHIAIENYSAGTGTLRVKYGSSVKGEMRTATVGADTTGLFAIYSSDNSSSFTITGATVSGTSPKLAWGGDTYLYRSASNTLKTDGGFVFGGGCALTQQCSKTDVFTLAGGSAEESFNVSISGYGFTAKPATGFCNSSSNKAYSARYDFDAAGNSSTNAVIKIYRYDGANTESGLIRFSMLFMQ